MYSFSCFFLCLRRFLFFSLFVSLISASFLSFLPHSRLYFSPLVLLHQVRFFLSLVFTCLRFHVFSWIVFPCVYVHEFCVRSQLIGNGICFVGFSYKKTKTTPSLTERDGGVVIYMATIQRYAQINCVTDVVKYGGKRSHAWMRTRHAGQHGARFTRAETLCAQF